MLNRLCPALASNAVIVRASSSFTPYKPIKQSSDEKKPSAFTKFGTRIKNNLMGKGSKEGFLNRPSRAGLNFSYPNKKGLYNFEPSYSLDEIKHELWPYLKTNTKMFINETVNRVKFDSPDMYNVLRQPPHNQLHIDYEFKSKDSLKIWRTGCDSVWGEGYSTCSFELTDHNTALFTGHIDTRIINDGRIERAGWASIKTVDRKAFNGKNYRRHWKDYSHLIIKCRGDGRSYKVLLHNPGHVDMQWLDSYSYPLHTHGGPYWQYERIPFSRFFSTVGGRIQDRQNLIPKFNVSNVGITIMDRIDGPFRLEIDYIGVVNDRTHEEVFAYEKYNLPILSAIGF